MDHELFRTLRIGRGLRRYEHQDGVTAGDRILATADRIPTAMFESPQAIIDAMIAAAHR